MPIFQVTSLLNRHTAMHRENSLALGQHTVDLYFLKDGLQQIVGMLDTLIERDKSR